MSSSLPSSSFHLLLSEAETIVLKGRIEGVKEELASAKVVRKNRQEYDEMSQRIEEQPSRSETTARLQKLESEIDDLLHQRNEIEAKLNEKRKITALAFALLDEADDGGADGPFIRVDCCSFLFCSFRRDLRSERRR